MGPDEVDFQSIESPAGNQEDIGRLANSEAWAWPCSII